MDWNVLWAGILQTKKDIAAKEGKDEDEVQLFTHVHAVHLEVFRNSSRTPNPFRCHLYPSLLRDNPLNGIFKKSDINQQPFISPESHNSRTTRCTCLSTHRWMQVPFWADVAMWLGLRCFSISEPIFFSGWKNINVRDQSPEIRSIRRHFEIKTHISEKKKKPFLSLATNKNTYCYDVLINNLILAYAFVPNKRWIN